MSIKGLKIPAVKDFEGMNILNALLYHKEILKRETDPIKLETATKRINNLKLEWKKHIA
ncbi:hypothetical protein [Clostridium sp.]|uniref:hypothetical protein n=1 Tax=Clostridium sp. TaxID=1506 RepID=UPI001A4962DB|nr:hypothetical protein [Clostridium sp.]MBK5239770.1 hypothetical protein [Clostridium sp.]